MVGELDERRLWRRSTRYGSGSCEKRCRTDHASIGASEANKLADQLGRLWAFAARLCLLPSSKASIPQAASRVQWYEKPKRQFAAHGLIFIAGLFEYEEYISLKSINDPNEG